MSFAIGPLAVVAVIVAFFLATLIPGFVKARRIRRANRARDRRELRRAAEREASK